MKRKIPEAIAVRYDPEKESAPRVVAKGRGEIAAKILEIARANGIPIYQDADMTQLLSAIELFDEVPPELYAAVAEILVWVYRTNKAAA